jgi:hypothetical protein
MSGIENGIKPVRITYLRCQRGKWKKIRIPSIFWSHVGDLILENSGRTSKRTCSYEAGGETEERERGGTREFAEEEEFDEFQTVFREPIKSPEEGEEVRELSCGTDSDFFVNKKK